MKKWFIKIYICLVRKTSSNLNTTCNAHSIALYATYIRDLPTQAALFFSVLRPSKPAHRNWFYHLIWTLCEEHGAWSRYHIYNNGSLSDITQHGSKWTKWHCQSHDLSSKEDSGYWNQSPTYPIQENSETIRKNEGFQAHLWQPRSFYDRRNAKLRYYRHRQHLKRILDSTLQNSLAFSILETLWESKRDTARH